MKKILLPKRMLASSATLLFLMTLMPLTANAETINTVTSTEIITKTSTVYIGEVVVDGVTQIKYLYSGDISIYSYVIQNLLDGLNGMADGDYAALLEGHSFDYSSQGKGFAICSDAELAPTIDGNWSSAEYVGTLYFPDKTVTSEINSNLYDIDEGFRAVLDSKTQYRIENIDTPADAKKCIVTQIDSNANSSVYYTVEDGEIIKHVDTHVEFLSEATTVIYSKVELGTSQPGSVLGDVNGDGEVNVTDVTMIVEYVMGQHNSSFIVANADVNGDGSITVTDVAEAVNIILDGNGGNTPQAYLTCPDDHHPHLIDLGLPSGTKWACCNLDDNPTKLSPTNYGGYYAWGEVKEKTCYDWSTYVHCDGSYDTCHDLGSDIAGTQYDVAHYQWDGSWVMPSLDQIKELMDNCSFEWMTLNGVNGRRFTGNNGGMIFLPATGCRHGDDLDDVGSFCFYWSSTQNPSYSYCACYFGFDSGYDRLFYGGYRCTGRTVRPVSK